MGWKERIQNGKQQRALRALFDDQNQDRTRADLATFFGPRTETYLAVYEKMRARPGRWARTWSWPGFLFGFVWFFYRKMYLVGAITILLPIIIGLLFPSVGTAGTLAAIGASAKAYYVQSALSRIIKADTLGLTGADRTDYLRRAGGVSLVAGVFAGVLYVALFALAIFGIYAKHHKVG